MSEVIFYQFKGFEGESYVKEAQFFETLSCLDRVTAERDAALSDAESLGEHLRTQVLIINSAANARDAALDREAELLEHLSTQDRVLRSSVPEEHKNCFSPVGAVQNYIVDLEQRLTAADERADLLEGLLREVVVLDPRGEFLGWQLDGKIDAALRPAQGGGDEQ